MEGLSLKNKDQKAIEMLAKLLKAARRAQDEGKGQALSKIIDRADKISGYLSDSFYQAQLARTIPADVFYKNYLYQKQRKLENNTSELFIKVEGVVVE
jgi:hypothetical protein